MLLSFSGERLVGKDTAAEVLINEFGFKRKALADPLKEICSEVFCIDLKYFHDQELKEKPFKKPLQVTKGHLKRLLDYCAQYEDVSGRAYVQVLNTCCVQLETPRKILQYIGSDVIRQYISSSFWLDLAMKTLPFNDSNVVVTDSRFANERDSLKKCGGQLCLIQRPMDKPKDVHLSENDLGTLNDYHHVINNNKSLEEFRSSVKEWYKANFGG